MKKYILVAESGADLPIDLVQKYDLAIVPMHVTFGGNTYDDGSIPVEDVFDHYEETKELPKTSGSTPEDFNKIFDRIHEQHPDSIIIHLAYSAVTTCSYESALTAAENRDYVHSYDTKSVSGGQAMVVCSIAEYLQQNPDVALPELETVIADRVERICMAAVPGSLEYLKAGGRLSNAAYMGGQLLKIKPLIEILDGKLVATKKFYGPINKVAADMFKEYLDRINLEKDKIFLLQSPRLRERTKNRIDEIIASHGFRDVSWVSTGGVISSHCGPGTFGIVGFSHS